MCSNALLNLAVIAMYYKDGMKVIFGGLLFQVVGRNTFVISRI
jgi:hypothetical protein